MRNGYCVLVLKCYRFFIENLSDSRASNGYMWEWSPEEAQCASSLPHFTAVYRYRYAYGGEHVEVVRHNVDCVAGSGPT
jgi:hypothetical protein